jgi:hypothetical protein
MSDYSEWKKAISDEPWHPAPRCEKPDVWWRTCDDDEGHEDYQYECRCCKKSWWVDGADA